MANKTKVVKAIAFFGLLSALAVFLFQLWQFWHYINDDAYITFRYSRMLAEGRGPYFNPGPHVEGYTNFLLMLILSLQAYVVGPEFMAITAKLIGAVSGALCVIVSFFFMNFLHTQAHLETRASFLWILCACGLVAVNPAFALNCTGSAALIIPVHIIVH